jgi:hypothetical protein
MLASYSLVPVTTILATVNWSNPYLFVELANRAPWRMGGADKVNAQIEATERDRVAEKQQHTDAHLTELSKDAWKVYRKKIGLGRAWNTTSAQTKTGPRQAPIAVRRPMTGFSRGDQL